MTPVWRWRLLVRVCRKWRQIIFGSPRRLHLQIFCTQKSPVRKNLDIWPNFPLIIAYFYNGRSIKPRGEGNVIAALKHPDRICSVTLQVLAPHLERFTTMMLEPFPVLTHLFLESGGENAPVLPDGFLGGSAPCLQKIIFYGVPFPALPTLLLSTNDLVMLHLLNTPTTGYISPEAMAVGLAALPRLEAFVIEFRLATARPNRICLVPPATRTVLPALSYFAFHGASEYLEDLVAYIDSPQLDEISISYLNQLVDFQVEQLSKFINRSVGPKLTLLRHVDVTFDSDRVSIIPYANQSPGILGPARTFINCNEIDWQVSHMAQVLSHLSVTLSSVVHLNLKVEPKGRQLMGMDDVEWQPLLRQFSTVKTLHVSQELAEHVALALEDITEEMVAEVLPSLNLICLEGLPVSFIEKFIAVRRFFGRPVTVINTEREFEEGLKSYARK